MRVASDVLAQSHGADDTVLVLLVGFSSVSALGVETALTTSPGPFSERNCVYVDSLPEAINTVERLRVNLIVVDLHCPTFHDGLRFCRKIKSAPDPPLILAFSSLHAGTEFAFAQLAGVDSYVASTEPPDQLASVAVSTLDRQCNWVFRRSDAADDPRLAVDDVSALTPREQEVLWMLSNRCTNEQIGRSLCISPHTAKNHVTAILRKLGVKRRSELFLGALNLASG